MNLPVILACGAAKRLVTSPAWDLYTGPYYRGCLGWAQSITDVDHLFILSAKYGLIRATTRLEPYEQRLNRRALPAASVRAQATALGLVGQQVVFLGGKDYAQLLREAGVFCRCPFAGPNMGQGKQIGLMRRCRGRYPTVDELARYHRKGKVLAA